MQISNHPRRIGNDMRAIAPKLPHNRRETLGELILTFLLIAAFMGLIVLIMSVSPLTPIV